MITDLYNDNNILETHVFGNYQPPHFIFNKEAEQMFRIVNYPALGNIP